MARVFDFPSEYTPWVEAAISVALADIGRDLQHRKDGRKRTIPDGFLEPKISGRSLVMVTKPNKLSTVAKARARKGVRK